MRTLRRVRCNERRQLLGELSGYSFQGPNGIALDPAGNIYVVGRSNSASLRGSTDANAGGHDGFVAMLDNYNGSLLWTRMFGTPGEEKGLSAKADFFGNVFVGGYTAGNMLGLRNAGATDAYVIKYDINGVRR